MRSCNLWIVMLWSSTNSHQVVTAGPYMITEWSSSGHWFFSRENIWFEKKEKNIKYTEKGIFFQVETALRRQRRKKLGEVKYLACQGLLYWQRRKWRKILWYSAQVFFWWEGARLLKSGCQRRHQCRFTWHIDWQCPLFFMAFDNRGIFSVPVASPAQPNVWPHPRCDRPGGEALKRCLQHIKVLWRLKVFVTPKTFVRTKMYLEYPKAICNTKKTFVTR